MTTALPSNRLGLSPTVESVPMGGPLDVSTTAVGAGLTYISPWFDVSAWSALRAQLSVAAFGGALAVQYTIDDAHAVLVAGVALPAVVAATPYDSGPIVPLAQWARFTYTQAGGGASGAFLFKLLAGQAGGVAGGGDATAANQAAQIAQGETRLATAVPGLSRTGALAATTPWFGTSLDCAAIPAIQVTGYFVMAAHTNPKQPTLALVWSEGVFTGVAPNDTWRTIERFGFPEGKPDTTGVNSDVGGFAIGRNRKARYCTLVLLNESADIMSALVVDTAALGAAVEEWDSTATATLCGYYETPTVVNTNAVFNVVSSLQPGVRLMLRVFGGDGICIRTDGRAVTTNDMAFFDGDLVGPFVSTARVNGIQARKRTAGTSDATIVVIALDHQGL